jgi:hypothetical protein
VSDQAAASSKSKHVLTLPEERQMASTRKRMKKHWNALRKLAR